MGDRQALSDLRRAHLVLDVAAKAAAGVKSKDIASLTTRMATSYAAKTDKTLSRDLNALRQMGLMHHRDSKWFAAVEKVRAFRPFTIDAAPWMNHGAAPLEAVTPAA